MDTETCRILDKMDEELDAVTWSHDTADVVATIANTLVGGYRRIMASQLGGASDREMEKFVYELELILRSRLVD